MFTANHHHSATASPRARHAARCPSKHLRDRERKKHPHNHVAVGDGTRIPLSLHGGLIPSHPAGSRPIPTRENSKRKLQHDSQKENSNPLLPCRQDECKPHSVEGRPTTASAGFLGGNFLNPNVGGNVVIPSPLIVHRRCDFA